MRVPQGAWSLEDQQAALGRDLHGARAGRVEDEDDAEQRGGSKATRSGSAEFLCVRPLAGRVPAPLSLCGTGCDPRAQSGPGPDGETVSGRGSAPHRAPEMADRPSGGSTPDRNPAAYLRLLCRQEPVEADRGFVYRRWHAGDWRPRRVRWQVTRAAIPAVAGQAAARDSLRSHADPANC